MWRHLSGGRDPKAADEARAANEAVAAFELTVKDDYENWSEADKERYTRLQRAAATAHEEAQPHPGCLVLPDVRCPELSHDQSP